ncbi:hypothetical protein [Defluviimonas sp. WL0075]|uniref:Uncharacterized protein n=1 Tax=Albidovulum sediminicola TaxID=2984331 RepID=A0ABT2YZI8_9RHOB|nr:hypothetical protein [Defluviimonas sp. WL0075]MCV2864298.1 hypothetical protein [Defluviimonas sp. WL0075]
MQKTFHSPSGGVDYLGLRQDRVGGTEIVYDDGVARRKVWRVRSAVSDRALGDILRTAVNQSRVVPALYAELRKRSIAVETVAG